MFARLEKYIYPKLEARSFFGDDEMYLFLITHVATIFAALVHIFLFLVLTVMNVPLLPQVNLVSLLVYVVCIIFAQRRKYMAACLGITLEVMAYTAFSTYYIGGGDEVLFFYFVALLMQLIIPYGSAWLRGTMSVFLWLGAVGTLWAGWHFRPQYMPSVLECHILAVFNMSVGFVGAVAELYLGNRVKKTIERYNKKRMEELRAQARTDPLTGLYNRRYADLFFESIAKNAVGKNWCVAMLDIDDFKKVNDDYGHAVGDRVLVMIADTLRATLRKTDVVFRWGGEEFLVFIDGVGPDAARPLLEKLKRRIADGKVETEEGDLQVTVTIGVAALDSSDISASIARSDERMYIGKRTGKNIVVT